MLSLAAVLTAGALGAGGTGSCPVTIPNGHTPPGERPSARHHGNGRLWTGFRADGRLVVPDVVFTDRVGLRADGSIQWKFPWWGSRSAGRRLRISGRRLDGDAAPLRSQISQGSQARSPRFWATYLFFPTQGCWSITGRAGRAKLKFVLSVSTAPLAR